MTLSKNTKAQISNIKSWKQRLSGSILIAGQSTIEFAFAMIVVMFLIYGMVMTFRWAGMDLANRRYLQDSSITTIIPTVTPTPEVDWWSGNTIIVNVYTYDPTTELNAADDVVLPMSTVYHGNISNGNSSQ